MEASNPYRAYDLSIACVIAILPQISAAAPEIVMIHECFKALPTRIGYTKHLIWLQQVFFAKPDGITFRTPEEALGIIRVSDTMNPVILV